MKVHLLYRDHDFEWMWALQAAAAREAARSARRYHPARDFDRQSGLPWNADALMSDLALEALFAAMGRNDDCVFEVARKVILDGSTGGHIETIRYRQSVLRDCLNHPTVVRELYAIAVEAIAIGGKHYLGSFMLQQPDSVLRWSIETMEGLLDPITRLKKLADAHAEAFSSQGWTRFFARVREELDDAYLASVKDHLVQLRFRNGVHLSACLGAGHKGRDYVLHIPPASEHSRLGRQLRVWLPWLFAPKPPRNSFTLHPRDESGFRALGKLKDRVIGIAANALGQSTEHVRDFFGALRAELAFYIGCINLHETLSAKREPWCMPIAAATHEHRMSFRGLYDVCLSLKLRERVVGNDATADGNDLVIVTGANQGGKSTFLRSVGLAQLMMQCGMFVPAKAYRSSVCDGLFTHFKGEEDAGMESGKLDEELARMSDIVDHLTPHPMILFNESFAATNEREGSEIARQICSALLEKRLRMVFVTHLSEFAHGLYVTSVGNVLFLRADRGPDGTRSFRLSEGPPLQTSYGEDLYGEIFGEQYPRGSQQDLA